MSGPAVLAECSSSGMTAAGVTGASPMAIFASPASPIRFGVSVLRLRQDPVAHGIRTNIRDGLYPVRDGVGGHGVGRRGQVWRDEMAAVRNGSGG